MTKSNFEERGAYFWRTGLEAEGCGRGRNKQLLITFFCLHTGSKRKNRLSKTLESTPSDRIPPARVFLLKVL